MDILVTATNEVAAVDAGQIIAQGSGFKLSDGTMYPPGLMLVQNVAIPEDLIGKRLSYIAGVFAELHAHTDSAVLAAKKAELILKIDADADALIAQVIGQRGLEYLEAEKQAAAYITANYTGAVPAFVQSWATAKNQTATWAADDIAATAAAWRNAQASMRANRLQHKEAARNAADAAALDAVSASWEAFLVAIKTQLGIQ